MFVSYFHWSVSKVHESNNLKEERFLWTHSYWGFGTLFLSVLGQRCFPPQHSKQTVRKRLRTRYNNQRHTSSDSLLPLSPSQSFKHFAIHCHQLWVQAVNLCPMRAHCIHTLYIIHVPTVGTFHILYIIHVLTVFSVLFSTLPLNV